MPPVHDPVIATNVFNRSMEAPITITQRELLSLSPEVRSQVRECTSSRRIPNKDATSHYYQEEEELLSFPSFAINNLHHRTPPAGSLVVPDPVETYYKNLRPGEAPDFDRLCVSLDSCAVRAVQALIDNNQKKECILDPGCQIIAMSEATSRELGIGYDPSIVLNMQSANGTVNQSLGLARNVPFRIGDLTFYLQAHVIQSPAYDVLLGRPFDTLTESVVRNFANEDQTITIHDPNTDKRITIPTLPRTHKCRGGCKHKEDQDF